MTGSRVLVCQRLTLLAVHQKVWARLVLVQSKNFTIWSLFKSAPATEVLFDVGQSVSQLVGRSRQLAGE